MKTETRLKQQALMLKAAFEEGWKEGSEWHSDEDFTQTPEQRLKLDWDASTAKQMHDQLLMEARGGTTVHG